jgi:hypothetical protein
MQQTTSLGVTGKYLVKIASVFGLHWLAKRFVGPSEAQMVLIGGGANIAISLVNDFAPGFLPANPLGMYLPTAFTTNPNPGAGVKAYVPLRGMRAISPLTATAAAFSGQPLTTVNRPGAVPFNQGGAYGGTAIRFKRF